MQAVIWTDVFQSLVIFVGLIAVSIKVINYNFFFNFKNNITYAL